MAFIPGRHFLLFVDRTLNATQLSPIIRQDGGD
jgi:hypothetical protein